MEDIIIPTVAIVSVFGFIPLCLGIAVMRSATKAKHAENMELIKQGIIPPREDDKTPNKYRSLRNGFLCVGVALGIIIGLIVTNTISHIEEGTEALIIVSSILLFLGIAYIGFYMVTRNAKGEEIDETFE